MDGMRNQDQTAAGREENEKMWLALLLAWVAGFADAIGFLTMKDIFFSAVSGNTVAVNASLATKDFGQAARHGSSILFFSGGLLVGAVIEKAAARLRIRRRFSIALSIEGALLVALLFLAPSFASSPGGLAEGSFQFYFLIALLSGAMGIQTASLRRVGQESVNTPFVTGMLVQSMENAVDVLFNGYDRWRGRKPEYPRDSLSKAIFHGALWLCFAVGALCGGLGETRWKFAALAAPIGALVFVIVCDLVRPIYD
jgi:uncharacterized membrane protein YoaK (UPF0700 family)